jgi:hypothetical protein
VPNTLFVDVDQVGGGSTQAVTVHLTPVDGKLTWFRNCPDRRERRGARL